MYSGNQLGGTMRVSGNKTNPGSEEAKTNANVNVATTIAQRALGRLPKVKRTIEATKLSSIDTLGKLSKRISTL